MGLVAVDKEDDMLMVFWYSFWSVIADLVNLFEDSDCLLAVLEIVDVLDGEWRSPDVWFAFVDFSHDFNLF